MRTTTIPALVDDEPPAEVDRLVDQYVENEHRTALSNSERITAIEQMTLAGLSEHQIAKRTATPKATVQAAKAAAQAPALREYADQLTLDQAAALTEFEDDAEAVEALLDAAQSGRFEHVVQRLRDDRQDAAQRAAFAARCRAGPDRGRRAGLRRRDPGPPPVAAHRRRRPRPHPREPRRLPRSRRLRHHRLAAAPNRITDTDHTVTDEDYDDEDDDFDADDQDGQPSWQPPVQVLVAGYVCTDAAAHGHLDRWAASGTGNGGREGSAPPT